MVIAASLVIMFLGLASLALGIDGNPRYETALNIAKVAVAAPLSFYLSATGGPILVIFCLNLVITVALFNLMRTT